MDTDLLLPVYGEGREDGLAVEPVSRGVLLKVPLAHGAVVEHLEVADVVGKVPDDRSLGIALARVSEQVLEQLLRGHGGHGFLAVSLVLTYSTFLALCFLLFS